MVSLDKNREMKFYKGPILKCQMHQILDQMVVYRDFPVQVHFQRSIQGGYSIR